MQNCGYQAKFFALIDECVPLSIASTPAFLNAFEIENFCSGRTLRTAEDLNSMRFCDTVTGGLTVAVNDPLADFEVFRDMEVIMGLGLSIIVMLMFLTDALQGRLLL